MVVSFFGTVACVLGYFADGGGGGGIGGRRLTV